MEHKVEDIKHLLTVGLTSNLERYRLILFLSPSKELKNKNYETLFVVDLTGGEDSVKALVEKFTDLIKANGEIASVAEWGKRRLAYPINDMNEGYYVLVEFSAPASFVAELERIFNITEGIMRSIVIAKEA